MTHPRPDLVIAEFWEKYFNSDEYKKSKLCMDPGHDKNLEEAKQFVRYHTASLGLKPDLTFNDDVDMMTEEAQRKLLDIVLVETDLPIYQGDQHRKSAMIYEYRMTMHPKTGEWSRLYANRIENDCFIGDEHQYYARKRTQFD